MGRSYAYLVPQIYLEQTHISVNSPENNTKAERFSTDKCREGTSKRVGREETRFGAQTDPWDCTKEGATPRVQRGERRGEEPGTHTERMNPYNIGL